MKERMVWRVAVSRRPGRQIAEKPPRHALVGSLAGLSPLEGAIQEAAEGGGVGEAVHEEV